MIKRDVGVDRLPLILCGIPTTAASAIFGCATAPTQSPPFPDGDPRRSARRHAPGDPVIAIFIATRAVAAEYIFLKVEK